MNLGSTAMSTLKLGNTQVAAAYLGSTLVWSNIVTYLDVVAADNPTNLWRCADTNATALRSIGAYNGSYYGSYTQSQDGAVAGNNAFKTNSGWGKIYIPWDGWPDYTTGDFSIELWVKAASFSCPAHPTKCHPVYKGAESVAGYNMTISTSGVISFNTSQSGAKQTTSTAANAITTGAWHHIVVTRSGAAVKIYVNGVDKTSVVGTHISPIHSTDFIAIGAYGDVADTSGDIYYDEIAFYTTCLTQARALAHFNASGIAFDTDATAYFARVVAAGSTISASNQTAVNAFIVGCKADGIWTAMKSFGFLCAADTLAGALVSLKGPNPVNYNFVSGDYSRTLGLKGDGSTKYLDTQYASSNAVRGSCHIATYQSETYTPRGIWIGYGDDDTVDYTLIYANGTNVFCNNQYGYSQFLTNQPSTTIGFAGINRSGASTTYSLVNNVQSNSTFTAVPTLGVATVGVFAQIVASGGTTYLQQPSASRLSFYSYGSSLSLALLRGRVNTLMSALT